MAPHLSSVQTDDVANATDPRSAILAAAISILRREGAGALAVRSVAAAAGCSTTGVYTWFGGKNGLVEAIFVDGFKRFGEALDAAKRGNSARKHLAALGEAYRTWALSNPTHYTVMFAKAVPDYEPSDDALAAARATFDQLVVATQAAVADNALRGEPFELAHHLWAGIHGYISLELAGMDLRANESDRAEAFRVGLQRQLAGCAPAVR